MGLATPTGTSLPGECGNMEFLISMRMAEEGGVGDGDIRRSMGWATRKVSLRLTGERVAEREGRSRSGERDCGR